METSLKVKKRPSPNWMFVYRFTLLITFSALWFALLFINNEPALNDASKAISSSTFWYFTAVALILGFAVGATLIEPKSRDRMQTEIVVAFLFVITAGGIEKYTLQTSGLFVASCALISYIFSRLLYAQWEENDYLKRRHERKGTNTLQNGPVMTIKKNDNSGRISGCGRLV